MNIKPILLGTLSFLVVSLSSELAVAQNGKTEADDLLQNMLTESDIEKSELDRTVERQKNQIATLEREISEALAAHSDLSAKVKIALKEYDTAKTELRESEELLKKLAEIKGLLGLE